MAKALDYMGVDEDRRKKMKNSGCWNQQALNLYEISEASNSKNTKITQRRKTTAIKTRGMIAQDKKINKIKRRRCRNGQRCRLHTKDVSVFDHSHDGENEVDNWRTTTGGVFRIKTPAAGIIMLITIKKEQ